MSSSSDVGNDHGRGIVHSRDDFGGSGLDDPLPRRPRVHICHELGLPFANQTRGSIANVVV
jgi:hypothetical protein